jgi:hypothetical protein
MLQDKAEKRIYFMRWFGIYGMVVLLTVSVGISAAPLSATAQPKTAAGKIGKEPAGKSSESTARQEYQKKVAAELKVISKNSGTLKPRCRKLPCSCSGCT